jgi:hypothetical protein
MKIKESILQDALREAIADINRRPNHVEKTLKEMALHMFNITGGELAYVLNGRTPVDTMSEDTMFKISRVLYEYMINNPSEFDITRLDTNKYFNENEQKQYNKKINRKTVETDIEREYYVPISDDQIMISFTNKELVQLADLSRIHYNPETQRALTTIETENGSIQKVTIDEKAYKDIFDSMYNNDYIPDLLTFNINPDSSEQPRIVNEKPIIPFGAIIDCIDGYHRVKVAIAVTKLKPDWNITFPVMLTGFDVKKAKRYILQEDKKTHLTKEQVTEDDQDDAANFIIGKLKDSNYLKDSGIQNISYQLNKIINSIFNPEKLKSTDARQKALVLFKNIEKEMNSLIEDNMWIGKIFSKEEWFIYLYLINYCSNQNKNFQDIIKKLNIDSLLEQISITNEPSPKQFKLMKEVLKNV